MIEFTHELPLDVGAYVELGGETFRVQKVEGSVVSLSKVVDGKVQKGRPTKAIVVEPSDPLKLD